MFLWLSYQDAKHLVNIIYMYYQYGTLINLDSRNLLDFGNNKIVSQESGARTLAPFVAIGVHRSQMSQAYFFEHNNLEVMFVWVTIST